MVVCQLQFICHRELSLEIAQSAISDLFEQYRYNGQILGREFALTLNNEGFECRLVCPEPDALDSKYDNDNVQQQKRQLLAIGMEGPLVSVIGLESQSDFTDQCQAPQGYILYSTFVQSCSPIRCSEHFMPVPLYKLPQSVRKSLIKWQESHAACDQLQMNGLAQVESMMVEQLSDVDSALNQQGKVILKEIEHSLGKPTYLYVYRVGGESEEQERQRLCPSCHQPWRLEQPLFDLFDFKCDKCQLVSNISWDFQ